MPIDLDQVKSDLENMSGLPYNIIRPIYGPNKQAPVENKYKLLAWSKSASEPGPLAAKVYKHFNLGVDGKQQAICPKTYGINNACPICNWIDSATSSEDPTLVERVKRIKQSERYLQVLIDYGHYLTEKDPVKRKRLGIYDCPPKIHRNIKQDMASQDYDFTVWADSPLVSLLGYSQGIGNPKAIDYKGVAMHQMKPQFVTVDPAEWLELIPDLEEVKKAPTPARLQQLLDGREAFSEEPAAVAHVEAEAEEAPVEVTVEPPTSAAPVTAATTSAQPKMGLAELVAKAKTKRTPAAA